MSPRLSVRVGALLLAIGVVVSPVAGNVVHALLQASAETAPPSPELYAAFARSLAFASLAASIIAAVGALLLGRFSAAQRPGAGLTLQGLAVIRVLAGVAGVVAVGRPELHMWQTSLALTIIDVVFVGTALAHAASFLREALASVSLARSARQLIAVYAIFRVGALASWAMTSSDHLQFVTSAHRAVSPIIAGGVAFLFLLVASRSGQPWQTSASRFPPPAG